MVVEVPKDPEQGGQEQDGVASQFQPAAATSEKAYLAMLDTIPVGFYTVRLQEGRSVIRHCNRQFAVMFGFENEDEAVGFDVESLYSRQAEREKLLSAMVSQDEAQESIVGYPLRVKTRTGLEKVFEVSSRVVQDQHGFITGRVGVVRDITSEAALRDFLDAIRADMGGLLHSLSSTLFGVHLSFRVLAASLGRDPFEGTAELPYERMLVALERPVRALTSSLSTLLGETPPGAPAVLAEVSRAELVRVQGLLSSVTEARDGEFRPIVARGASLSVLEVCRNVRERDRVRGTLRRVQTQARRVVRICNFITLHQASTSVVDADAQISLFREYVVSGLIPEEKKKMSVAKVGELIAAAARNLEEFARSRGVNVRYQVSDPNARVKVAVRDVVRAMTNLLHNAIKYSWDGRDGQAPWVTVSARMEGGKLRVDFENWGVPIRSEEIERDLVFQTGYRGALSGVRGRLGTGIGLTDARQVARANNGDVTIQSHPATDDSQARDALDYYAQLFLTRATFLLPLYHDRESDAP